MAFISKAIAVSADDGFWNDGLSAFDSSLTGVTMGNASASNYPCHGFFRFTSVLIPNKARIVSARLVLVCTGTGTNHEVYLKVHCNNVDNATAPTTYADANGKALTTAYGSWTPDYNTTGGTFYTADFATAVQEVVDRAGWVAGNALMVLIKNNASTLDHAINAASYDNVTYTEPVLEVVYSDTGDVAMPPYFRF